MAVPKTKEDLLYQAEENYKKLNLLVDSYSEEAEKKEFPPGTMNRNIRDVLGHLYHWHLLMFDWYDQGMKGEEPPMPAPGYKWNQLSDLNLMIWEKCQQIPLSEIRKNLDQSHQKSMEIIKAHSQEELFEKKRYPWTGSSSMATYFRVNTAGHYNWAYKLIRKVLK